MYNQPQQGIPMQQYHQPGIQYEPQPMMVMPNNNISPHTMPMGGAQMSPPGNGGNNDPMVDGLLYYPALVVKQKRNSLWEYLCNCEEENVSSLFFLKQLFFIILANAFFRTFSL